MSTYAAQANTAHALLTRKGATVTFTRKSASAFNPVTQTETGANFHVFVVNEDDRRGLSDTLRRIAPGIADSTVSTILNMPRSTLCMDAGCP